MTATTENTGFWAIPTTVAEAMRLQANITEVRTLLVVAAEALNSLCVNPVLGGAPETAGLLDEVSALRKRLSLAATDLYSRENAITNALWTAGQPLPIA